MSNKIDPTQHRLVDKSAQKISSTGPDSRVRGDGSGKSSAAAGNTAGADTVVLTERAQLIERLEKKAAALPVIDRARVEAVKADIASGNYEIDLDNIAEILLRTELEFGDS